MDEKTKLYVFEKKEVALIFIFMILMATSSFIFGIKIGKNYSFKEAGHTEEDTKKVELLSTDEEHVKDITDTHGAAAKPQDPEAMKDLAFQRLKEKIDTEFNADGNEKQTESNGATPETKANSESAPAKETKPHETVQTESKQVSVGRDEYSGKYTIQLGSHRSQEEAEKFADGFRIRGYNPIINEVKIKDRGIWYRVSIGVFDSIASAKDYIVKEKSLFQDLDYVIGKFD